MATLSMDGGMFLWMSRMALECFGGLSNSQPHRPGVGILLELLELIVIFHIHLTKLRRAIRGFIIILIEQAR